MIELIFSGCSYNMFFKFDEFLMNFLYSLEMNLLVLINNMGLFKVEC